VPLAGAARKGDRVTVAVPKAAVGDAPAVRPGRELSDNDAARLYGHYVGTSGDRHRGARRARGRGPVARRRAATAPPTRSASARLREARGRVPQAGGSGRLRWLPLAGLGSALLGVVGILAGRRRRRRAPTLGEVLRRALGELLAAFQAALPRGRGRRWFGSLGGPRRGGGRWRGAG
jgi:LPXTG-motif cell wall-anchored protein